jgi:hypothetical protein
MTLNLNNGLVLKFDLAEIMGGHLHLNTMITRTVHFLRNLLFMMNPHALFLLNHDLFHLSDLLLAYLYMVKNNDLGHLIQVCLDLPNLKNPFVIPQH